MIMHCDYFDCQSNVSPLWGSIEWKFLNVQMCHPYGVQLNGSFLMYKYITPLGFNCMVVSGFTNVLPR